MIFGNLEKINYNVLCLFEWCLCINFYIFLCYLFELKKFKWGVCGYFGGSIIVVENKNVKIVI